MFLLHSCTMLVPMFSTQSGQPRPLPPTHSRNPRISGTEAHPIIPCILQLCFRSFRTEDHRAVRVWNGVAHEHRCRGRGDLDQARAEVGVHAQGRRRGQGNCIERRGQFPWEDAGYHKVCASLSLACRVRVAAPPTPLRSLRKKKHEADKPYSGIAWAQIRRVEQASDLISKASDRCLSTKRARCRPFDMVYTRISSVRSPSMGRTLLRSWWSLSRVKQGTSSFWLWLGVLGIRSWLYDLLPFLSISSWFNFMLSKNRIVVPPEGYLKKVAELCKKHNVLLICDEIQTVHRHSLPIFYFDIKFWFRAFVVRGSYLHASTRGSDRTLSCLEKLFQVEVSAIIFPHANAFIVFFCLFDKCILCLLSSQTRI